jgi:hypothetical protein
LRIAAYPPHWPDLASSGFFLFSCLSISKLASKDSNSDLQVNFLRDSQKFWRTSALILWKRFSGGEWINRLDRCIAPLQQMERPWNEVQDGEKVLDRRVSLKVLKLNDFPSDLFMKILPIVCNHQS